MLNLPCQAQGFLACNVKRARQSCSNLIPLFRATLLIAAALTMASGQESERTWAEHSAIVVRGTVLKINASDEAMLAASRSTAVISVVQVYSGREIAGDLRGRTATVILSHPAGVEVGEEFLFFGNPRFLGRSLTIADEGETSVKKGGPTMLSALEQSSQARKDAPIVARIATAKLVFRGAVESVNPLEKATGESKQTALPPSEHDPEWQVASVRISKAIRGGEAGQAVTVIFPASRDIVWFSAPKLKLKQDAVFLVHLPNKQDLRVAQIRGFAKLEEKQPVYFVTEPSDVLPPADEERVRGLLVNAKETKE